MKRKVNNIILKSGIDDMKKLKELFNPYNINLLKTNVTETLTNKRILESKTLLNKLNFFCV